MPFDAATGAVEQNFSFLQTGHGSIDLTWYNLYQSAGNPIVPIDPARGLGSNWSARQFAEVVDHGNGTVAVMFAPGRAGCNGGGPGGGGGGPGGGGGGVVAMEAPERAYRQVTRIGLQLTRHLPQPPTCPVSDVWQC